ncbi:chemotaxis protein [Piscirickettsia salmonis]|uniref:chemotaxis protein n=1 Tax=Piscirickettsia salmonis TaxID=1238 RepID=UPI000F085485|nr:response regulator [Piscirickettsiaceae bacterium NZ-RLO2]
MRANLLENIDSRTKLVGRNRFEALVFSIHGRQYAINVFKVREVLHLPELTVLPESHPAVLGVVHIRNQSLAVIDTCQAIFAKKTLDPLSGILIVTEYNHSVQGFLVHEVHHIINATWENVIAAPEATGKDKYITSVLKINEEGATSLIQVIDVEKVIYEIHPAQYDIKVSTNTLENVVIEQAPHYTALVVDDSLIARKQVKKALDTIGVKSILMRNGREALDYLINVLPGAGGDITQKYLMVIADVEMPEIDGYAFIKACREHPGLKNLFIILNTSITGVFNENDIQQTDCNEFIGKVNPQKIIECARMQILNRVGQ